MAIVGYCWLLSLLIFCKKKKGRINFSRTMRISKMYIPLFESHLQFYHPNKSYFLVCEGTSIHTYNMNRTSRSWHSVSYIHKYEPIYCKISDSKILDVRYISHTSQTQSIVLSSRQKNAFWEKELCDNIEEFFNISNI